MTQCFPSFYLSSPEWSRIFTLRQSPVTPLTRFPTSTGPGQTASPESLATLLDSTLFPVHQIQPTLKYHVHFLSRGSATVYIFAVILCD